VVFFSEVLNLLSPQDHVQGFCLFPVRFMWDPGSCQIAKAIGIVVDGSSLLGSSASIMSKAPMS